MVCHGKELLNSSNFVPQSSRDELQVIFLDIYYWSSVKWLLVLNSSNY